jgi:hypothetical protein
MLLLLLSNVSLRFRQPILRLRRIIVRPRSLGEHRKLLLWFALGGLASVQKTKQVRSCVGGRRALTEAGRRLRCSWSRRSGNRKRLGLLGILRGASHKSSKQARRISRRRGRLMDLSGRRKLRLRETGWLVLICLLLAERLRVLVMLVRLRLRRRKLLMLLVFHSPRRQTFLRYMSLVASDAGTASAAEFQQVQEAGSAISISTTTVGTIATTVCRHGRIHRRRRCWRRKIHEREGRARLFSSAVAVLQRWSSKEIRESTRESSMLNQMNKQ